MGLTLVACLPAAMLMRDYAGTGIVLAVYGLFLAGLSNFTLDESRRISEGIALKNVSISQAAENPQATAFYFKDAKIHQELMGEYRFTPGGKNKREIATYVAPLTDSDWTPEAPVRAWVVSSSFESTKNWKLAHQAGVRWQSTSGQELASRAIDKVREKHNLIVPDRPLLLVQWGNPQEKVQHGLSGLKKAFALPFILWFLGLSAHWLKKRTGKRA